MCDVSRTQKKEILLGFYDITLLFPILLFPLLLVCILSPLFPSFHECFSTQTIEFPSHDNERNRELCNSEEIVEKYDCFLLHFSHKYIMKMNANQICKLLLHFSYFHACWSDFRFEIHEAFEKTCYINCSLEEIFNVGLATFNEKFKRCVIEIIVVSLINF